MRELRTEDEVDAAFGEAVALVYKHSTRCPISLMAHQEVERFAEAHPEVPVYLVDVIFGRPLSLYLAQRTGIVHQSPQAILLRGGEPAWSASHMGITADALADSLGAAVRQPP
ncbi:MAG: bacillithiol system redox-active protein YtxJ [Longimicrobiaceae bacterium]